MKKIGILLIGIIICSTVSAQSFISDFQKKYEKEAEFTIVNISPKMFQLIGTMADSAEESIIKNLTGLQMISSKKDINKYYKDAVSRLSKTKHEELMSFENQSENMRMFTQEKDGVINSLIMAIQSPTEFTLIGITGVIDLKQLSSLAKTLNIEHLEKLDSIK